jgi:lipoate-protein ligase A
MVNRALRATGGDPVLNLALEESLLRGGKAAASLLLLYVDDPCVVVGRNQNPWAEAAPGSGLRVLRRASGGGTVYHDRGNLNWSLIVPRSEHDPAAELGLVALALRELGIETESGPRGGLFVAGGPWKGKKISGTARRLEGQRVMHHGTLLVAADLEALASSLGGIEASGPRALRSVGSPSVNLSALCPGLGVEEVAKLLARVLAGSPCEEAEPHADESSREAAARRLASWEWTWGATPAFELPLRWGGGEARITVKEGIVAAARGPGSERLVPWLGARFDYGIPASALAVLEGRGPEPVGRRG